MLVKELIEKLMGFDPDKEVYIFNHEFGELEDLSRVVDGYHYDDDKQIPNVILESK